METLTLSSLAKPKDPVIDAIEHSGTALLSYRLSITNTRKTPFIVNLIRRQDKAHATK